VFGEAEIARVAAAAADRATRQARAELERGLEAKRAEALDRAAASLAEIAASRRREAAGARDQVLALAGAIAEAVAAERDVAEAVRGALEALPGAPAVRVLVDDLAAAPLRASLPKIAARAGFAGGIEVIADPRVVPGSAQVVGAGGWLEHDPARIRARVAAALAAHRTTGATADEPLAAPSPAPPEN
jgi:flagellar biosynthesis/type III secretory pathway protein FliH